MAIVERANVVLEIADDEDLISKYLAKGYSVTNGKGTVLKESIPFDTESLRAKIVALQKELQEKDDALAKKDKEIAKLKKAKKKE